MLMGRTGCGKTTLIQALKGEKIRYHKTQYVDNFDTFIDTPGEYAENVEMGSALILYSYEADAVGLLLNATEEYSLFSPNAVAGATREVVGIVTQIDRKMVDKWVKDLVIVKTFCTDRPMRPLIL